MDKELSDLSVYFELIMKIYQNKYVVYIDHCLRIYYS